VIAPRPFADSVSRFVFERAAVRGALASLDDACHAILDRHAYPSALRRALAELLGASVLLASTLKFKGTLVVQLQGTGPVQLLVVECDAELNLRATAQWHGDAEALPADTPLRTLAGDPARSRLAISLDPKDGGPIYQGIVALEASSIATLIEHYLTASEQIDSRMVLATDDARVRGMLLQRMPSAGPDDDVTWQRAASRMEMPAAELLAAPGVEALLAARFHDDDVRVFAPRPARFRCGCSPDRVAKALRLLGRVEIESILAEQGAVGVTCEFCNRQYRFEADDALALFREPDARGAAPDATRQH
jgi:molecular chaperone Hsp33